MSTGRGSNDSTGGGIPCSLIGKAGASESNWLCFDGGVKPSIEVFSVSAPSSSDVDELLSKIDWFDRLRGTDRRELAPGDPSGASRWFVRAGIGTGDTGREAIVLLGDFEGTTGGGVSRIFGGAGGGAEGRLPRGEPDCRMPVS